jgi:hypothetical protein
MVKWLLPDPDREQGLEHAQDIMDKVCTGRAELIEPVPWLIRSGRRHYPPVTADGRR